LDSTVAQFIGEKLIGTAPASPKGSEFKAFASALDDEFDVVASDFAFTANGYDAAYVGAMGLVYASFETNAYDGRELASGLAKLITGPSVQVSKTDWGAAKAGLTTADRSIDVRGLSGELQFDPATGEAPAPIEIWRPSSDPQKCGGKAPCIVTIDTVQ
jgi:hypothetical protein